MAFGGGSFAGVTALLAAITLPHVFGGILVESPSLWAAEGRFLAVRLLRGAVQPAWALVYTDLFMSYVASRHDTFNSYVCTRRTLEQIVNKDKHSMVGACVTYLMCVITSVLH